MGTALDRDLGEAFTSFFGGMEIFPILDREVILIARISPRLLSRYEEFGLISRSVINENRPRAEISHFNFYDVFRFDLIKQLHLKPFIGNAMLEEILEELLDTFALEIDQMLAYSQPRTRHNVELSVASHYVERENEWRQFWLLDGERLDPIRAAQKCVEIWMSTFEVSAQVIVDFKNQCRGAPSFQ